jgi:hypothetical protein
VRPCTRAHAKKGCTKSTEAAARCCKKCCGRGPHAAARASAQRNRKFRCARARALRLASDPRAPTTECHSVACFRLGLRLRLALAGVLVHCSMGSRGNAALRGLHLGQMRPNDPLREPCPSTHTPRQPCLHPLGLGPPVPRSPAGPAGEGAQLVAIALQHGAADRVCERVPLRSHTQGYTPLTYQPRWAPLVSARGADRIFVLLMTAGPLARYAAHGHACARPRRVVARAGRHSLGPSMVMHAAFLGVDLLGDMSGDDTVPLSSASRAHSAREHSRKRGTVLL